MRLLKTDRLVPLVTISLIAVFSFMLYLDFTRKYTWSRAGEIGTLAYKKRIAERRFAEEVLWEGIEQNAKVHDCDYLRTTDESGAVVNLKDGTNIEIGEDTLILVCLTKQGIKIDLDRGSVAARSTAGGRALKITSGNASIDMKKGVVSVNRRKQGSSLSVASGSADVTVGGKKEKIDSTTTATISGNRVTLEKVSARQISPDINQYFVSPGKEHRVEFTWEPEGGRPVILQVAKDSAFKTNAGRVADAEKKAALVLQSGTYYWRLADEAGKTGPARVFTIVSDRPAVPVSPNQSEQFSCKEKNPFVQFAWDPASAASSYTVEIGADPAFKKPVMSLKSDTNSIATDALKPGTYYWRVRNAYGFNTAVALVSGPRQFSIVRVRDMPAPEPLLPNDGDTVSDMSIASGRALFNWGGNPDYTGYELIIARDENSATIVYRDLTGNNFHKPKIALEKGTYFWTVRGMTAGGAVSQSSKPVKIMVAGEKPPVLIAPDVGAAIDLAALKQVTFRWNGVNGGQRYRFELSTDKGFKKIVRGDAVTGLTHTAPLPGPGVYFWRVKLLDGGAGLVSEGRQLSVMEALAAPGGAYPVNNETVAINSRSGMVLKWKPVEGATHYQVSVKRLVAGKEKVVLTARVGTNKYNLTKTELLDAGRFMWEVSAIKQKGNKTVAQSKPEQNYFSIKPGKQLKAPKLKSQVLYVE